MQHNIWDHMEEVGSTDQPESDASDPINSILKRAIDNARQVGSRWLRLTYNVQTVIAPHIDGRYQADMGAILPGHLFSALRQRLEQLQDQGTPTLTERDIEQLIFNDELEVVIKLTDPA